MDHPVPFCLHVNVIPCYDAAVDLSYSFWMVSVDAILTIKFVKSLVSLPVPPCTMRVSFHSDLFLYSNSTLYMLMIFQFQQIATENENVHLYPMYYVQS